MNKQKKYRTDKKTTENMDKNHKDHRNCTDMPDPFLHLSHLSAKGTWKKWNQKKIFQAKHRYLNPRNQPKRAGRMDGSAIMVRSMPTTKIS